MAHDRELLVRWLNDAHALEKAQIPVLEDHAEDAKDFPDVQARDAQHVNETRRHVDLVEGCLASLGESPSAVKSGFGTLAGTAQGVMTGPFKDELVKNFPADFAAENMEIASYNAIITAARDMGEDDIASTCEQILSEEEAMADWLRDNLPSAVREALRA